MGSAPLSSDVAHMLGGGVLLFAFVLLYQRRLAAVIGAFGIQGGLLALAVGWQGVLQASPALYLAGLVALAKAVLVPLALRRLLKRLGLLRAAEPGPGVGTSLIAGVALVALAILVVLPATIGPSGAGGGNLGGGLSGGTLAREDLAIALSVVLLGMLMMITRRHAISQVIGLLSLENGLLLAAAGVQGSLPLMVELSTAVLVLAAGAGILLSLRQGEATAPPPALLQRPPGERP